MRAAILLLPIVAIGAVAVSSAPPAGDYNSAMTMDTVMDVNAADMNATAGMPIAPTWAGGGDWLYGGTEESGVNWYIDERASDFEARPARVIVRSDDSAVEGSRYGFTERELAIDCAKMRYRVARTRHYDRAGNAAGPVQPGGGPLIRAGTDGIYGQVVQTACVEAMLSQGLANMVSMNGM